MGQGGCQEHPKCGDTLLTQWPVSNKPRSFLAHQSDEHLWRYFFPRKGTSLKEMSRCQPENIANQNTSWHSPDPWLMSFQLKTWNSRLAPGDSEIGSMWLKAQNVQRGFRNPMTKDNGVISSHKISELEFLILNYFIKNGGEYGSAKGRRSSLM